MHQPFFGLFVPVSLLPLLSGCTALHRSEDGGLTMLESIVTSEAGQRMAQSPISLFREGEASGTVIRVFPSEMRQTMEGIGTSFTESSAFVLAHLDPAHRRKVMERIFSEDGANFSMARTHIGSCDFTVEGRYSYADSVDPGLSSFSIRPDVAGFDGSKYPGVRDTSYDLLPMIWEAMEIKRAQREDELRIVASAWTAPPWMKDVEDWFIGMTPENDWQGTGGSLKPEHESTYARYLVEYLRAYRDAGVSVWGLTPVNEPHGNSG